MKQSEEKTNVMRILDQHKINYKSFCYVNTNAVNGKEVAEVLHQDPNQVFKTLVTTSKSGTNYVFMLPVCDELDLKKCASSVGEKNIEMLKSKDLLGLTGYIHGGCSPIGMKKRFTTVVHESAKNYQTIIFSAGKIGYQVELSTADLNKIVPVKFADIIVK